MGRVRSTLRTAIISLIHHGPQNTADPTATAALPDTIFVRMAQDDSPNLIDYETPLPKARRTVTIPRGLYSIHKGMLCNLEWISIIYGVLVMTAAWAFEVVGVMFTVVPERKGR